MKKVKRHEMLSDKHRILSKKCDTCKTYYYANTLATYTIIINQYL